MLDIRNLTIDNNSLGAKMLLTEIRPAYIYENGKKTDKISGYRYDVALPKHGLEKLSVRIDGDQQMQPPEDGFIEVGFSGLVVRAYIKDGVAMFTATATGISPVGRKVPA